MGVKITDLMDTYHDTIVPLPETDLPTTQRTMDLTMSKINQNNKKKTRFPKGLLIAAVLVMIFSLTAGATYMIHHQKTIELMETGPFSGGYQPLEIDDQSKSIIDTESHDVNLTSISEDATLTLDSVMGFYGVDSSLVYTTFTLSVPDDVEFTSDASDLGFREVSITKTNDDDYYYGGASTSTTAIENEDGTISIMLSSIFRSDITNIPFTYTLKGFGNVSKEVARELYSGQREIEIPGTWTLDVGVIELSTPKTIPFDPEEFEGTLLSPKEIKLSPFGGTISVNPLDDQSVLDAIMKQRYPEVDVDWKNITEEKLKELANESILTTERFDEALAIMDIYGSGGMIERIALLYPDGTEYEGWSIPLNPQEHTIIFDAPQDIESAEYLILNDVKIPLK